MSKQKLYIDKNRTLTNSEEYSLLRKKGLEYIEKLSSSIWTDYNVHDPGITMLEMLCYAITDLGYRTQYDIEDILEEENSSKNNKHFFTARQILTCNPVTANDFRRVLIDIEGIKNAWLEKAGNLEQNLYINCSESKLTVTPSKTNQYNQVNLNGIYNVILEFEEDDGHGDLNDFSFEKIITTDKEEFTICTVFPSWDYYFSAGQQISDLKIDSVQHIANSQYYKAILKVKIDEKETSANLMIKSTGKVTDANNTLIEKVIKRIDQNSLLYNYKNKINKALDITAIAHQVLQNTRNLCEDYYLIKGIDIEQLLVCADIEVRAEADIDKTLAKIYYELERFINPHVKFYTIKELFDKGKTNDEIFEGPILNHGFIDEDELDYSDFTQVVHVSDLIQIIMDVENVIAVKDIIVSNSYKCENLNKGERWCLKIEKGKTFRLNANKSKIIFYKGLVPYAADKDEVLEKLNDLEMLDRPQMLAKENYDLSIPKGKNRHIKNYYSIQNDFPFCYGIGEEGLAPSVSQERKAQAKQLKGFLLLYDQMLANYFEQLGHVRDLYSTNPKLKKTYFSHNLFLSQPVEYNEIPSVHYLLKEFIDTLDLTSVDIDNFSSYETDWNNFITSSSNNPPWNKRDELLESQKTYEDRRNRFLDHLMARFAEQFTDYVLLMYSIDKKKADSELIDDKIAFLNDYHQVSYNRGKAFDYNSSGDVWNTFNVTGLERRVARILGINNYKRRWLYKNITDYFEIYQEKDSDNIDEFRFRLLDDEGNVIISSTTRYYNEEDAIKEIKQVLKYGHTINNYEIKKTKGSRFHIVLKDGTDEIIARMIKYFNQEEEAEETIKLIIKWVEKVIAETEGFHLIEHILLRPKTSTDELLRVCVNKECKNCLGFIDPYSFRATAVVPYWPERFQNFDFRKFFEMTVRMEAPANVHVKICWVTQDQMKSFETNYKKWLEQISKKKPNKKLIKKAQDELVKVLQTLRSVYPETRLYDCEKQDEDSVVLLDHSVLGSISEDENGSM